MGNILHNLKHFLIAIDQLANVFLGLVTFRKAWADETISSQAWRWHEAGVRSWPKQIIDTLFFLAPDHCLRSFENERASRHLPPEARE